MQPWKTLSRQTILNHSKWLTIEDHTVELPNGRLIPNWPWVITPDYINVIAVTQEDEFLCFRQTKYGVEGLSLAPVGGYIEPNEDPLVAAKRELLEETGYAASEWLALGSYRVDANRGGGIGHLYLARNAARVQAINADDLEEMELLRLSRAEITTALRNGEFKVLAWAANVALALQWLE